MDVSKKIRKIGTGNLLFALVALFVLSNSLALAGKLKQLPSPVYGGGYYKGL